MNDRDVAHYGINVDIKRAIEQFCRRKRTLHCLVSTIAETEW